MFLAKFISLYVFPVTLKGAKVLMCNSSRELNLYLKYRHVLISSEIRGYIIGDFYFLFAILSSKDFLKQWETFVLLISFFSFCFL